MVITLPLSAARAGESRPRGLSWAVAFSILLHIAAIWYFVSRFVIEPALEEPQTINIDIQPLVLPPTPPPPAITPDRPQTPRFKPRDPIAQPEAPPMPPIPLPPQVPTEEPPTVNTLPETVPAAAPTPTHRVNPAYPRRAEAAEMEGTATIQLTIGAGGVVTSVEIIGESPLGYGFGEAAKRAVGKWEFADTAPGTYRVTVRFAMQDG